MRVCAVTDCPSNAAVAGIVTTRAQDVQLHWRKVIEHFINEVTGHMGVHVSVSVWGGVTDNCLHQGPATSTHPAKQKKPSMTPYIHIYEVEYFLDINACLDLA